MTGRHPTADTRPVRTEAQVRADLKRQHLSPIEWADESGYPHKLVLEVLDGRRKATRGMSHEIAVLLGLQAGSLTQVEESRRRRQACVRETAASDPCAIARCRKRFIAALGAEIDVPRYIVRCDDRSTRGWQMRFGTPTEFYADTRYGGASAALEAAKASLRAVWVDGTAHHGPLPAAPHVIRDSHGKWYAHTAIPYGHKRFYIGTDGTRTWLRERRALERASRAQQKAYGDLSKGARLPGDDAIRILATQEDRRQRAEADLERAQGQIQAQEAVIADLKPQINAQKRGKGAAG